MMVQLNERALFSLGFDQAGVEAMRHLIRQIGSIVGEQTLPETVRIQAMNGMDAQHATVADLMKEVESLKVQIESMARYSELSKRIEDLERQLAESGESAQLGELSKIAADISLDATFPAPPTNWENPGAIGLHTHNTGDFTRISAEAGTVALPSLYLGTDATTGLYRIGANNWGMSISGVKLMDYSSALVTVIGAARAIAPSYAPGGGYSASFESNGANAGQVQFGADEAGGYTWQRSIQQGVGAVPHRFYLFNTVYMTLSTTGLTVIGNVSTNNQFVSTLATGTPPMVVSSTTRVLNLYATRALEADGLTSPSALAPVATDLPTVITLANSLRAAAAAKGL